MSLALFAGPSRGESFDIKTLQSLFDQYQRQQAYDYARQHLLDMEGDPYFDYYYGVAAIDTGHASEGVFALERVLVAFPEDHVARLELARGYFILEEYARARIEFERVLATSPPAGVIATTEQFLDRIRLKEARYRTTSDGYVALAMGTDSNVNSGTDGDQLTLVELSADSLGQEDTFSELQAGWQITHPFSPGWMVNSGITAVQRMNQDYDQFDTRTGTLQLGVTNIRKLSRYKAELLMQTYQLDGNDYRDMAGLNLEWHYAMSQKARLGTTLQYLALDYPDLQYRNSTLTTLGLSYNYSFAGKRNPTLFTNLNIGAESADDGSSANALSDVERDILGLRIGGIISLTAKLGLQMSVGYQTSDYAGAQTFPLYADIIREDELTTADINLLWLFSKHWRLDTKVSYMDNSSNVELYNYDRNIVSLNVNYSF